MSQSPQEVGSIGCDPATAPEPTAECDPAEDPWYAPCNDLSEFTGRQYAKNGSDRLSIIGVEELPAVVDGPALRAEVKDGDVAYNEGDPSKGSTGSDWRTEILGLHMKQSEDVICYTWHTLFPSGPTEPYPEHPRMSKEEVGKPWTDRNHPWQVFFQWHQGDENLPHSAGDVGNSPPLEFIVENDQMVLRLNEPDYDGELYPAGDPMRSKTKGRWEIGPLERGRWHSFRVEIRWHLTDGLLRVWHNGEPLCFRSPKPPYPAGADVFPDKDTWELTGIGTLFPARKVKLEDGSVEDGPNDPEAYLKAGLYRKAARAWVANPDPDNPKPIASGPFIVYHDELRQCVLKRV